MSEHRSSGKQGLPVKRAYRETPDVVDAVCRLVRSVGKRVAGEDTDGIEQLSLVEAALSDAWTVAVAGLRRNYSDRAIGDALGITRQAVEQRWPRSREECRAA